MRFSARSARYVTSSAVTVMTRRFQIAITHAL
jgi:hypothetical protein